MTDLAHTMEAVALALWGEPNRRLSSETELRFGTHGSRSVDLVQGVWHDHEVGKGGGVLDAIREVKGLGNGAAFAWMREHGITVDEPAAHPTPARGQRRTVAAYDYADEHGELLYQVIRYEPKDFRQRRPDPTAKDGWTYGVKGVRLVPYRLPELLEDLSLERTIYVVEGEKAVDALRARGIPATCNPMGAGKWPPAFAEWFDGASVVVARDNNKAGHDHGIKVAENLKEVAASLRLFDPPGVAEKDGLDDWLNAHPLDADGLAEAVATLGFALGEAPIVSRYNALWLHEIVGRRSSMPWLVKGLVPSHGFGAIVGEPGCGKSFLALDLACAVSILALVEGEDARWFTRRLQAAGVAYVAAEGQIGFVKRVEALVKRYHLQDLRRFPFVLLPTAVDLCTADGDTRGLIEELQAIGRAMRERTGVPLSIIVVDTLNRAIAGRDENDSEIMGAFIRNAALIQAATGATVIVVHHKNASGTRERGHSSLRGALDFMIEVEKDPEGGNLWKVAKQKDEEDGASFGFTLNGVVVGLDDDGDAVTSCTVEPIEAPGARASKAGGQRRLPPQAKNAFQILFNLCAEEGHRVPGLGFDQAGTTLQAWKGRCRAENLVAPDSPDNTLNTAFQRALDTLRSVGRIGVMGDHVWPVLRKHD